MLSNKGLMKYLRDTHKIEIKSYQSKDLRNIGYYHGYKGYRFIKNSNKQIKFNTFDEIVALNTFDNKLKEILYPKLLFIETALKSYVIELVLYDSKTEDFNVIFEKSLTDYKNYIKNVEIYRQKFKMRIDLRNKIFNTLSNDYYSKKKIVEHFFDADIIIPIWAIFESITLGEFGVFYSCLNKNSKIYTSKILKLPSNLDSDGEIIKYIIYCIKDLRNAIAHNNVIFDVRFKTNNINSKIIRLLEKEIGLKNINFNNIDSYVILIIYIIVKMGESNNECNNFINNYIESCETLLKAIPYNLYVQILGTQHISNVNTLKEYIKNY